MMSAGMPGVGAFVSPDLSMGSSASSPLFGEMFAQAASANETSGLIPEMVSSEQPAVPIQVPSSALMTHSGKSASLLMAGISGVMEDVPEQSAPVLHESVPLEAGVGVNKEVTIRQENAENVLVPDQRLLSLVKGRKMEKDVPVVAAEEDMEEQSSSDTGPDTAGDVSTAKTAEHVHGVSVVPTDKAMGRAIEVEGSASSNLLAGGIGVVPADPVVCDVPPGLKAAMIPNGELPVPPAAAPDAAGNVVAAARRFHEDMQSVGMAWTESRPVTMEGMSGQITNDGVASEKPEVFSSGRDEAVYTAKAGTVENFSFVSKMNGSKGVEEGAGTKDVLSAQVASPDAAETIDTVSVVRKSNGGEHSASALREKVSLVDPAPGNITSAFKGEAVQRELPSGVTVVNPAQTVTSGRTAEMTGIVSHGEETSAMGRITQPEGESAKDNGLEHTVAAGDEKVALENEDFSSQGDSDMNRDFGTAGENRELSGTMVKPGSFDTVIKGQMEPLSEVPELRESILSQVREKIVNHEPVAEGDRITLKLNPRELGELQITVRLENQKMSVEVTAQNHAVKEVLLQNIDQLKDSLMRQNIAVDRFDVSTGTGQQQAFDQSFREGRHAAKQGFEDMQYGVSGYYRDDVQTTRVAYGEVPESSLVDMRF